MAQVFIKPQFRVIPAILLLVPTIILFYLCIWDAEKYFYILSGMTCWFLFNSVCMAFFSFVTMYRCKVAEEKKYDVMLQTLSATTGIDSSAILHYVIVPNYNEPIEVLEETLDRVSKSTISREQIGICLAMEEREVGHEEKAKALMAKFEGQFRDIFYSVHPGDIEGEQRGKGSNGNWGCRMLEKRLKEKGEVLDNVLLTLTDADTNYHPQFFEALTYEFLTHSDKYRTLFQTPMLSYINVLRVPFGNRLSGLMGGLNELARSSNPLDIHITYSCYSISYRFWESFGGFDVQNISDDTRACVKGYVYTNGESRVTTIYLPTLNYVVESDTYWKSLWGKFDQAKRHAWGVSEFSCLLQDLSERGLSNYIHGINSLVYLLNLLFRLIDSHWSPAVGLLFANVSGVAFNYYQFLQPWFESNPDKEATFRIMAAAGLLMRINAYFVVAQIAFFVATLIALWKWCRNMRWYHGPFVIIEWIILGMPSMILFGTIPAWISTLRFVLTDRFTFITSQKHVIEKHSDSVEPAIQQI
jgi:hypothetical protein